MNQLLYGAIVLACAVASLFFLRFWRETRDRLFALFSAAFVVFGGHWLALALTDQQHQHRPFLYLMRLVAFLLIILAIIDKNRRPQRNPR